MLKELIALQEKYKKSEGSDLAICMIVTILLSCIFSGKLGKLHSQLTDFAKEEIENMQSERN